MAGWLSLLFSSLMKGSTFSSSGLMTSTKLVVMITCSSGTQVQGQAKRLKGRKQPSTCGGQHEADGDGHMRQQRWQRRRAK